MVALDLSGKPAWSVVPYPGARFTRYAGEALVDPVTDRLLVVGGDGPGQPRSEVWALPLAGGAWENWSSPSDTLPQLNDSDARSTVIDPERRRLFRYSGVYRYDMIDTCGFWAFDLDSRSGWTPLAPPGPKPRAQRGAGTALDPATGRFYLMGGDGYDRWGRGFRRHDVYELPPGGGWTPLFLSGDVEYTIEGSASAFDPAGPRAVLFTARGYTRLIDYANPNYQDWEEQDTFNSPMSRKFSAMTFDPPGNRALLFGGKIDTAELNDLWQVTFANALATWTRIYPDGDVPSARFGTASVFDPIRRRWILFGGFAGRALDETWALELNGPPRWHRLVTHGPLPSARFLASGVYDTKRDGMILFGGSGGDFEHVVPMKDAWFLSFADGDTWQPLATTGSPPLARYEHAAMYDPVRDRMLVFWGRDGTGARFECGSLELSGIPTWKEYIPAGPPSATRFGLQAYYLPTLDRAAILGGGTAYDPFTEGSNPEWYLDFAPAAGGPAPAGPPLALLGMGPNPTESGVDVAFQLPVTTVVRLRVYDARGRLVRAFADRAFPAGRHLVHWDGVGEDGYRPRPGVYFARLALGAREFHGKVVLLR